MNEGTEQAKRKEIMLELIEGFFFSLGDWQKAFIARKWFEWNLKKSISQLWAGNSRLECAMSRHLDISVGSKGSREERQVGATQFHISCCTFFPPYLLPAFFVGHLAPKPHERDTQRKCFLRSTLAQDQEAMATFQWLPKRQREGLHAESPHSPASLIFLKHQGHYHAACGGPNISVSFLTPLQEPSLSRITAKEKQVFKVERREAG